MEMENRSNTDVKRVTQKNVSVRAAKRRHRRNKAKNRLYSVLVAAALVLILGYVAFDKCFVIKSFAVKCDGEADYTPEQAETMAKDLGIEKGMHLFGFNRAEAEKTARFKLSEFDAVRVRYALPDGIVLEVKPSEPVMYISVGGSSYVLSEGLRVLSVSADASAVENGFLKRVLIGGVTSCVAGNFITADSGCDEILKDLYAVLKEENCLADADDLDISDKFDLTFTYRKRFTVKLGGADNLSVKVRFMKSIADKLSDKATGIIDVSDENYREGMFKPY